MSLCIYLGLREINTRWGNKVNLVLVAYQTTEQLLTSGCETPKFIRSERKRENGFIFVTHPTRICQNPTR